MRLKSLLLVLSLLFLPLLCRAQVDTSDVLWQYYQNWITNVFSMTFSPDSRFLAVYTIPTGVTVLNVPDGQLLKRIDYNRVPQFTPNGNYLTVQNGTILSFWDVNTWEKVTEDTLAFDLGSYEFTKDYRFLVSASDINGVCIYETQNWNLIKKIDSFPYIKDIHTGTGSPRANFLSLSYDDRYLAFSGISGNWSFIYDFVVDSIVKTFRLSERPKFSPVRNEIVYYLQDDYPHSPYKGLIYYKLDTGDSTYIDVNNVNDFAFSPDGNYISIANALRNVQIWSLIDNHLIYTYNNWPADHHNITNSHNGLYIADEAGSIFLLGARWTTSGVIEPNIDSFKVFPNPSNNELEIEFSIINPETTEIVIIDINGNTKKNTK